jgi:hypothetical protein
MTISSTTNTVSYTGNGSTTEFSVNYVFFGTGTSAEIQVVEVVIATGAETVKSNGSDFTVSGGNGATGTVTAAVAPASTVKWVINRTTTQTQETDYVENDPFPAESHEEALDRLTAVDQEQQRALDRTAQLPDGYTGSFDPTLPTTITANTALVINATADGFIVGPTAAEISSAQTYATNAASSASAASTSETNAAASASAASTSETNAAASAATYAAVTSYGAVGDGVTDDTVAIQAAVDSGAAIIWFPAGEYLVSSININAPIKLMGSAYTRFNGLDDPIVSIRSSSDTATIFNVTAEGVMIEGIKFTGTAARVTNNASAIAVGASSVTASDGVMTAGFATLVSASAAFVAADIGKNVLVAGAYNGTSTPTIASINNPTSVQLSAVADNTVSGATYRYAKNINSFFARNVHTASHGRGLYLVNVRDYIISECSLQSKYAIEVNNQVAPDSGDGIISDSMLQGSLASGYYNLLVRSGGGLRIDNCKFLDSEFAIYFQWSTGTSGGPIIRGSSIENYTTSAIALTGTDQINGTIISNNWFNSGTAPIAIGPNLTVKYLSITGNVFAGEASNPFIEIGELTDGFDVSGNFIEDTATGSAATGVAIRAGAANGNVRNNTYIGVSTPVANSATQGDNVSVGRDAFKATLSSDQTITSAAFTKINWNVATIDESNQLDTSTDYAHEVERNGIYHYWGVVKLNSVTAGNTIQVRLRDSVSGATFQTFYSPSPITGNVSVPFDLIIEADSADKIIVEVYHNNASSRDVKSTESFFAGERLS